jgi:hypothetical protein
MHLRNSFLILLASLLIMTVFGCGSGGGGTANIDSSTSSNAQTGDGNTTTGDGGTTTGDGGTTAGAGTVTLSWVAPATNTDGSYLNPATDLSMYRIYYGSASLTYTDVADVTNPGTTTISTTLNLTPGTYYFAVTTVDIFGQESSYSNEVMKTI